MQHVARSIILPLSFGIFLANKSQMYNSHIGDKHLLMYVYKIEQFDEGIQYLCEGT